MNGFGEGCVAYQNGAATGSSAPVGGRAIAKGEQTSKALLLTS